MNGQAQPHSQPEPTSGRTEVVTLSWTDPWRWLRLAAQDELTRLRDLQGETVLLATLDQDRVVVVACEEAGRQAPLSASPGTPLAIHLCALGHAMAAHLDPVQQRRLLDVGAADQDPAEAARWREALQARAELRAQVAGADLLVVTKADRVDCARLAASFQRLQLQQPRARVMASAQGDLPVAQVLEAFEPLQGLGAASPTGDAQGPRAAHADHGHHGEGHVHDAIARFLPLPRPFARADLMRRLQRGLARAGGRLMRLKGVVLAEDGGAVAVQWAPGDEIPVLAPGSGPLPEPGLTAIAADSGALQDLAQALGA